MLLQSNIIQLYMNKLLLTFFVCSSHAIDPVCISTDRAYTHVYKFGQSNPIAVSVTILFTQLLVRFLRSELFILIKEDYRELKRNYRARMLLSPKLQYIATARVNFFQEMQDNIIDAICYSLPTYIISQDTTDITLQYDSSRLRLPNLKNIEEIRRAIQRAYDNKQILLLDVITYKNMQDFFLKDSQKSIHTGLSTNVQKLSTNVFYKSVPSYLTSTCTMWFSDSMMQAARDNNTQDIPFNCIYFMHFYIHTIKYLTCVIIIRDTNINPNQDARDNKTAEIQIYRDREYYKRAITVEEMDFAISGLHFAIERFIPFNTIIEIDFKCTIYPTYEDEMQFQAYMQNLYKEPVDPKLFVEDINDIQQIFPMWYRLFLSVDNTDIRIFKKTCLIKYYMN